MARPAPIPETPPAPTPEGQGAARTSRTARTGRLFVALWPDRATRAALMRWQKTHDWPPAARLTPARDLHLTLVFIGALSAEQLDTVAAAVAEPVTPFQVRLDHIEHWRGGLVVASASSVPTALAAEQHQIETALRTLGLAIDERPWKPHVTLARRGAGAALRGGVGVVPPPIEWRGAGHVLAMRDGEHYRVLHRFGAEAVASVDAVPYRERKRQRT